MKDIIKTTIITMILMLTLAFTSGMMQAEAAQAKTLKTKTVKMYTGQKKTIKTSKKIKRVSSSWLGTAKTKKTGSKKFRITTDSKSTSIIENATITVRYTNGDKQKFKVIVTDKWGKKVVDEVRGLLADPDASLRKLASDYAPNGRVLMISAVNYDNSAVLKNLDAALSEMTVSQKQAMVLNLYAITHMKYGGKTHDYSRASWKHLYEGKFVSVCNPSAERMAELGQYLGFETRVVNASAYMNHAWCVMKVTDADGTAYYQRVWGTADGYSLKANYPKQRSENHIKNQSELDQYAYTKREWKFKWMPERMANRSYASQS